MNSNNQQVFFALVRAGLWEKDVQLSQYEKIGFNEVYRLAEEQTVIGLVAAGLEHTTDLKAPKEIALQFVGRTMHLEQRNLSMNRFVGDLIRRMKDSGVETLLVKGQGIAQCYERPLWRAAGDVDLFLDDVNYQKAKELFKGIASLMRREDEYTKHVGMEVGPWEVELHGNMRAGVTARMDRAIDAVQTDTFHNHNVRVWRNGEVEVLLPSPDNDVIIVFTHILHHFYRGGGIGLRQICDWCRLLYVYDDQIDRTVLKKRLEEAAIIPEWKLFGGLAVKFLGMPEDAMPFYEEPNGRDLKKIEQILDFLMERGNFGHKRDLSYYRKYPFLIRKCISLWRKGGDILHQYLIFPANSCRYFFRFLSSGFISAARGEG